MTLENLKIADIVLEDIRLAGFFQDENIDFCCNGHRQLQEVLAEKALDPEAFFQRLEAHQAALDAKGAKEDFFNAMTNEELITHIRLNHHMFTRQVLKELDVFTSAILKAHYRHAPELLLQVNRLYGGLRMELLEHLIKEEEELFPLILGERYAEARVLLEATEEEHDAAGKLLATLRSITSDYTLPDWACNTFKATYHHLEALESDLFRHIFLENSILFERF